MGEKGNPINCLKWREAALTSAEPVRKSDVTVRNGKAEKCGMKWRVEPCGIVGKEIPAVIKRPL